VLYPFFSALLWAAILVFSTWPVFAWLRTRARLGRIGAALVMVVLTAVLIVLPIAWAAPASGDDINQLRLALQDFLAGGLPVAPAWLDQVPLAGPVVTEYWNSWSADVSAMESFFRPYLGMLAENGLQLLYIVAKGIAHFLLALFIAFFFWWAGESMAVHLSAIMHRIAGSYADRLLDVTGRTVRGTVYGVLGTAIVQGILTGFGLFLADVPRPLLLGAVAGFLAVLPIGAPLVWIPAGLWLLSSGHTGRGIFLLVYGVAAVSGADHLIRPYFIARGAQLPFLVTMLGLLGGVLAFGFLGIFLGPVLLGVGFTLVAEFANDGEPDVQLWK
jgi:predicted PurR-regulated permease PerM